MPSPTTPILSTFTGSDTSPLSEGGNWSIAKLDSGCADLRLVSNAVGCQTGQQGSSCYVTPYAANQEAYFTMTVKWPVDGVGIFALSNLQTPALASTIKGYLYTLYGLSGDVAEIYRIDNGVLTIIGPTVTGLTVSAGDKFLGRNVSGILTLSQNSGSGWNTIATRTDNTYGAGQIGLGCDANTTIRMDDFGGGSYIDAGVFRTLSHRPFPFLPGSPNISRF